MNATKATLLGLNMHHISDTLIVTGDPIPTSERDLVKAVFNFNSVVLSRYIHQLNEVEFKHLPFHVFGAFDINARNLSVEIRRAKKKHEVGMSVLFTQPILSKRAMERIMTMKSVLPDVKILAGILPVVSERNALFMKNEMNGIDIDDEIVKRYIGLDRQAAEQVAFEISLDIMNQIKDAVDGLYLITPFKRTSLIAQLLNAFRAQSMDVNLGRSKMDSNSKI